MKVRVEFKDGTERLFDDCDTWVYKPQEGVCRIGKRNAAATTYTSKFFSRKVVVKTEEETMLDIAFLELDEVFLVEQLT